MAVGRIPVVMFLKYDPKDAIIVLCGFIFGPLSALTVTVIVSLFEMLSVSETGFIGLLMNIIASASFACTASLIYKKNRTLKGAVIGLIAGSALMTAMMLLWNYLITPFYMGYPREAVAELLVPVFLPFNLIKAGINSAFAFLMYRPLTLALRRTNMLPPSEQAKNKKTNAVVITALSMFTLVTFVLLALVLAGKL